MRYALQVRDPEIKHEASYGCLHVGRYGHSYVRPALPAWLPGCRTGSSSGVLSMVRPLAALPGIHSACRLPAPCWRLPACPRPPPPP